ncbi:MAG: CAP domain-containing protein [Chitinophagales bacterium]
MQRILSNRAGKVFHSSESDAAYIALLEKQMENTDQYSTDDWFVDFIQNLDTVNTYVTDPEIFADLKWGMIEDYYVFSYHREQADSAFNWMMRYTCAEQKVDMIDFIARQISYDTYVYNNSNGISVEGSDPEFGLWKEILSCLHPGNDANNDLSAYIRTLISDGAFMLSAELLYNAKRNGMPKNISQDLEKRLYDAISMDSAAELSHVDLYYISKYLPGNSYISSLQQNASIAAIDKYIAQNKFSEAGALLRQQIAEYPNDKTINMLYVQWVMQDYAVNYIGSMTPYDMLAVSDPDNCKAGKLSKECQDLFLKRLNYVRRLAGVPDQCVLREEWNKKCQDAALMMQANYSLSHGPPDTWSCYSASGYEGASHSNLSLGEAGSAALMGQVDDYGSNNTSVGHRRWILNPYRKVYGHGSNTSSMALWALGGTDSNYPDSLTDKYDNQFVAWPPAYYCPLPFFTHRWSFSLSNVDFSETTVEMYRGNKKIKVEVLEQEFGYGQNTIVWEPDMEYYLNSPDTFKIVLKHVKQYTYDPVTYERQERDETYTYTVQFIQVN